MKKKLFDSGQRGKKKRKGLGRERVVTAEAPLVF